jgi:multiple sugar transport system permease protein
MRHNTTTSWMTKNLLARPFFILVIVLLAVLTLLPFFWGLVTSLKPANEILAYPPKLSGFRWSFEHYVNVFDSGFFRSMLITVFYCAASIVCGLIVGLMMAYAIKRYRFPGRNVLFYLIVCGIPLSIGSSALIVPNYVFFSILKFINHPYTLVVLYCAYFLPMAVWIIMGGIEGIPVEIEESMIIDGVGRAYIIFNMTPRLCLPSMAAAALFIFIGGWNDFLLGSVMINSNALKPIQVSIYNYMGYFGREWGPLAASSIAAVIPIMIVFTLLGRLMISGLTQGSVKG